jgi:predicted MFS family arabinose efflux permease
MNVNKVRAMIALTIVGVFMFITAFMAIYPLVTPAKVQLTDYSDFFAKTASVYTGIIGVIIGYYFGRTSEKPEGVSKST